MERLVARPLGPEMPTMREVRALGAAADAASGRSKRGLDLAARAQSARAARTAFMAARRGEAERRAAAQAAPPVAPAKPTRAPKVNPHAAKAVEANAAVDRLSAAMDKAQVMHMGEASRKMEALRSEARQLAHGKGMSAGQKAALAKDVDSLIAWHGAKAAEHEAAAQPKPARPRVSPPRYPVTKEKQTLAVEHGFMGRPERWQSVANANGIHVVRHGDGFTLVRASDGRRMILGTTRQKEAMDLLAAGASGRTLARARGISAKEGSPESRRASRAVARYQRTLERRKGEALLNGPAAPIPKAPPAAAMAKPAPVAEANPAKVRADFAERRAARVTRLEGRVVKVTRESEAHYAKAARIANMRDGQPIIIGHHSEKRGRADQRRIEQGMRKGGALHRQAVEAARRANAARKSRAISSDDPSAIGKLQAKLAHHKALQERMTATNKVIRAAERKGQNPHDALVAMGHSPANAHKLVQPDFAGRRGFPDYATKNNSAEMRRTEKRIADLTAHRAAPSTPAETHGRHSIEEGGNRVKVTFAGKPSEATRSYMKSNGFRWSPREGVWQRNTSATAWQHARAAAAMEG